MGAPTDDKSKEAPAGPSSSNERPPSYDREDPVEQIALELPKLNLEASSGGIGKTVTRDQCVAHLKFLAVLADLRDVISNTDGLFGINNSDVDGKFSQPTDQNAARAKIKEKRWAVYTARAADRYTAWWFNCLPVSQSRATLKMVKDEHYEQITSPDKASDISWSTNNLPPIDILMVWHSHMLNPRNFLEDCIRYGRMSTWRTGFPFKPVNDCIDDRSLEYTVSDKCKKKFEKKAQLKWHNLDDPSTKQLQCPACSLETAVPWTRPKFGDSLEKAFKESTGYADNKFGAKCYHCSFELTHDRLKVNKFRQDLIHLIRQKEPMPGTVLDSNGIPRGKPKRGSALSHTNMMFPNIIMKAIGQETIDFTSPQSNMCRSIDDLRSHLEPRILNTKILKSLGLGSAKPGYKMFFRRMMSRHLCPKMDNIDWLHSPTVLDTADRLIKKYTIFLRIMLDHPLKLAVPTLDVDLAWHTHQLMPRRYYAYTTTLSAVMKRFIDHDDKVDENKLSEGFEWTSKMYRRATKGGIYSECTCWYCEATRAPDLYDRLLPLGSAARARTNANSLHDRADISADPERNPHISAHNAVRPTVGTDGNPQLGTLQRMRLQRNYEKSVRRAKKGQRKGDGIAEPLYYSPLAWGYPLYVPYYAPYMCDPGISADSYACNPSCMSTGAGAVGNCCSGTCGGGVAAGSCGGIGSGAACAGGSAACGK
ncbi:hypothetical protein N7468_005139 [Penicillium chermesinum]|uniref:Uncharacterized protein n=1 Tax=Penicillium chermesinum TaxID=63820 RepID=A0A9W9P194_9EURO|nr:uncharacterized protein N7468_005139 [Penicillium chermesinum]KAJ5232183.1 hypothetical protein N7468_005139 [Penicillium chermesinum]